MLSIDDGGRMCLLTFASGAFADFHMANLQNRGQRVERYCFFGDTCHAVIDNSLPVTYQRGIGFPIRPKQVVRAGRAGLRRDGLGPADQRRHDGEHAAIQAGCLQRDERLLRARAGGHAGHGRLTRVRALGSVGVRGGIAVEWPPHGT